MASVRTRFADFVFDPSSGELWRDGQPVRLESQPAVVLARLIATPSVLVSREELASRLWGADTHVQSDDGINYCIRQVRLALGDNPRTPLFIETIPRRGYRFIAAVQADRPSGAGRRILPALAAAVFLLMAIAETRPNNHHEIAVSVARAVHDLIF